MGDETYTVEIVRQDVEVVHLRLKRLGVQILQVLVLGRQNNRQSPRANSLTELNHEIDLVAHVDGGIAAAALGTWPLPVDVDALELPLLEELQYRGDEGAAVGLAARHLGPGVACGAGVREFPAACVC